jgi:hypothetical protein
MKIYEAQDALVAQDKALATQKQIMAIQQTALNLAMLEVPIDQFEIWVKRSEIQLPKSVAPNETFSFHYPKSIGNADVADIFFSVDIHGPDQISMMPRFVHEEARDFIYSVYQRALCGMQITPESVTDEPYGNKLQIINYDISAVELTGDQLHFTFKPMQLRAAYFNNRKVRLEIGKSHVLALNAPLPATGAECRRPQTIRLRLSTFGFTADTSFFPSKWNSDYFGWIALSPPIVFQESFNGDQPMPVGRLAGASRQ